jgi:hypothetical protein
MAEGDPFEACELIQSTMAPDIIMRAQAAQPLATA